MNSVRSFNVFMPARILFGAGRTSEVGAETATYGKRAMLVTYRDTRGLEDTIERVIGYLKEAGVSVTQYAEVEPDPPVEILNRGAELVREKEIDVMVGLGGGSAIDAAKAIAVVGVNGGGAWEYAACNSSPTEIPSCLPIVAVPTTSGTGSEVTAVSVITNREIVSKAAIVSPHIIPKVAIVDPELMSTMPPRLTASTGADAFGHALEAFVSVKATPFVARMSSEAIRLIWENLPTAYKDGGNMLARANMAWASTIAGMMLVQSGTIGNHSLAQALGAHMHVPHGVGVALGTPLFLEYCRAEASEVYLQLARELGIGQGMERDDDIIDEFIQQVKSFLGRLDLPTDLKDRAHEVDREALIENAIFNAPGALGNTPRKVTHKDMAEIISRIL